MVFIAGCTGAPPTTPIINSFSPSPSTITVGDSSTLSWSVTDATSVTIDHGVGSVASSTGTYSVSPAATTVYTLTATNATGSVTATTTVTVNPAAITYGSIDINSSPAGAKVYLDGVDTGMITPIVLPNIAAGTHAIKLDKYYYKIKEETNVSVTAGATTYLNWSLTYASTETITLQPGSEGKDSDVSTWSPTSNYGNSPEFWAGYSSGKWRAYLEFDLSPNPLPAGAVVTNAYLYLYQFYAYGSVSLGVYRVTGNWVESSITWNNQPSSSSVAEDSYFVGSSAGTWRYWYVDDLVQDWLDGSISNNGILLKPTNESSNTTYAKFYSSDTSDSTKRPKLVISYYIP